MIFSLPLLLALGKFIHASGTSGTSGATDVASFSPKIGHQTYTTDMKTESGASRVVSMAKMTPLESAQMFVKTKLGFNPDNYIVKNLYTSDHNKMTHIYLRQKVDDKEIFNADINLNISEDGQIISYGDSFYRVDSTKRGAVPVRNEFPANAVPATEAMESLMEQLHIQKQGPVVEVPQDYDGNNELKLKNVPGAVQDVSAVQGWIQLENGSLEPVWDFQVELAEDYYHSQVSATTKKTISLINWVSKASYNVIPFGVNDPLVGKRQLITDPQDKVASRLGWHDFGDKKTNDTAGNNVYAVTVPRGSSGELDPKSRVQGDKNRKFDFTMDETKDPKTYKEAAITNLFYYNNIIHDLYYRYGFNEQAGNFQDNNFDLGGKGGDAVIAHGQDSSGINNAMFSTPPDGRRPSMYMFLFNLLNPNRDGDFDSGIMIHEYSHGLSNRLTGGPANSDCLGNGEAGGLGEGWGDFIATMIRMNSTNTNTTDVGIGEYVTGRKTIRKFIYSTSLTTNPSTFEFIGTQKYQEVHNAGEVWAEILFEVYWKLAGVLPITNDWFASSTDSSKYANTLLLQLVIDGMKLQPCRPSFLYARDAILLAEKVLTKEKFKCPLWAGFAKRGMGVDAKVVPGDGEKSHKNSFALPKGC